MPLASHLMLKYRDVLADPLLGRGERSPTNFHQQLLRIASDKGLNVFATVNNRFIIDRLPVLEHQLLEREFLNDSTRAKFARLRSRRKGDEPDFVLFTRVGALITLKAMLAIGASGKFTETAVGACALHANDYAESDDTAGLSSGILPVVTEFAPVRDLQNPPEAGPLFRRFGHIYRTLLTQHAEMKQVLRDELDCEADELTYAGLRFDEYFSVLFGIYAVTLASAQRKPFPTSILDLHEVAEKAHIGKDRLLTFIKDRSMTEDQARDLIGSITSCEAFAKCVSDSGWATDFRVFRNKPLLELRDGRYVVLDLQFLYESASCGLYWSVFRRLSDQGKRRFAEAWGSLFETYVLQLISHYFPNLRAHEKIDGREIDGVLETEDAIFLIEVKSGFLPEDAKGSRDPVKFANAVKRKFVRNDKGKAKGVGQLAAAVESLRSAKLPTDVDDRRIYAVLVGEDPVLASFAMNTYLDDIFVKSIAVGRSEDRLAVIVIDEAEHILPYVSQGDIRIRHLLDARIVSGRMSPEPVGSTFNTLATNRRLNVRGETFLSTQGAELTAILDRAFKGLE